MSKHSFSAQEKIDLQPGMHIHLVGIGGAGLSAIARVLLGRGFVVSGSDQQMTDTTNQLVEAGAVIFNRHEAKNIFGADLLLISSAIPESNPEVIAARAADIPVYKREGFLGALMNGAYGIAVAGSHGKTTTTGMLAQILIEAELDPSVIIGGDLTAIGGNGRAGQGEHFIVEADEYDYMFLGLQPNAAIVTNVEYDHPDLFSSRNEYVNVFKKFVQSLPAGGLLVLCDDDPGAVELKNYANELDITIVTYGLDRGQWRALDLRKNQIGGLDFLVDFEGGTIGLARSRVPGEHNVSNALAAIAVASKLGIDFGVIRQALAKFGGIGRRFQIIGEEADVIVIDDYAHHPTEIKATLLAARERFPGRRIWAVWQPHTFSRTKELQAEFAASFKDADRVVALDIFKSRETDDLGIDTSKVLAMMNHPNATYIPGINEAAAYILDRINRGDVLLTLTAGDGNLVGEAVLSGLQRRNGNHIDHKHSLSLN